MSALNSLSNVAKFYLNKTMDKTDRDVFVTGTVHDVLADFNSLVEYCARDVETTHEVLRVVFPKFLAKKTRGNATSFGGMLEMSSGILPIAPRWHTYIQTCDKMLAEGQVKVARKLRELAEEYRATGTASPEECKSDHYLRQLDFSPVGRRKLPSWYRDLIPARQIEPTITIRSRVTPLLLRMTWSGYPLYYLGTSFGWCYRVPLSEVQRIRNEVPVTVDAHSVEKVRQSELKYLELVRGETDARFYRLPSLRGGVGENCGSPLAKAFLAWFEQGKLDAAHPLAREAIKINASCSYWISARERIRQQFIVWPQEDQENLDGDRTLAEQYGICLPPVVPSKKTGV